MSTHGFVYMLMNDLMPHVVKIGCTERSPHLRAEELSKSTGVPGPFKIVCYIEVPDHQGVERRMHNWLRGSRVSPNREFFHIQDYDFLTGIFVHHPEKLAFTDVSLIDFVGASADAVPDPWRKTQPESAPMESAPPALRVVGGFDENAEL